MVVGIVICAIALGIFTFIEIYHYKKMKNDLSEMLASIDRFNANIEEMKKELENKEN